MEGPQRRRCRARSGGGRASPSPLAGAALGRPSSSRRRPRLLPPTRGGGPSRRLAPWVAGQRPVQALGSGPGAPGRRRGGGGAGGVAWLGLPALPFLPLRQMLLQGLCTEGQLCPGEELPAAAAAAARAGSGGVAARGSLVPVVGGSSGSAPGRASSAGEASWATAEIAGPVRRRRWSACVFPSVARGSRGRLEAPTPEDGATEPRDDLIRPAAGPQVVSSMAMGLGTTSQNPLSPQSQEGPALPSTEVFVYDEGDFVLHGVEWQGNSLCGPARAPLSHFDRALQLGWKDRLNRGLFRYHLGELRTRILRGTVGFVAQLNIQRGLERRRPQEIQSVQQSFDPQQFNFCRIQPEEILFCMTRSGTPSMQAVPFVLIVINVSPLQFGHILLIPEPALSLPQVLTPEVLHFGLDALLLSAHPGFRIGFNSLGAFASVNHLHLHGYYLDWELLVESAPCVPLLPEANLYLLQEVPAPGFLFYSDGQQLEKLTHQIGQVTNYLVEKEIAHNLFITRGATPRGPIRSGARPGIRIIVWARKACFGVKEESAFNVALCELAGHLPIKTVEDFEGLTEASAIHTIQKYLLSDFQFVKLQCELVDLLKG